MLIGPSGVQFVYSRVWLQTELDDTKFCCQFIVTVTIFENINAFFFGERAFNTNVQNEKKYDRQRHCLMLQIRPFWKIPSLVG